MTNTYSYSDVFNASKKYFNDDELAAKVFADKYALQNDKGEYLELTPTDMHKRLAKEFARIEAKYPNPMSEEEIFGLMDKFKYVVPQGSPMSAIGNSYQLQSASNCFVGETKVLTLNEGVKQIKDVKVGDVVVSHTGERRKVVQIHKNLLNNRQIFDVKCFRTPKIAVTSNHEFWSITNEQLEWNENPQWNAIKDLRKGDWIAIPSNLDGTDEDTIDVFEIVKSSNNDNIEEYYYSYELENELVSIITHYKIADKHVSKTHNNKVNRFWTVDKQFAFFLGLWYGDGCIFSTDKKSDRLRGITFTFNKKEKEAIDFVVKFGEKTFGLAADVNYNNSDVDSTVQVVFHSTIIAQVFQSLFGRGCSGKKLYNNSFFWSKKMIEELIKGIVSSDGTITSTGDVRIVMKNVAFIESLYHLARRAGIPLGISYNIDSKQGRVGIARLDFPKNSFIIKNIFKEYADDRIKTSLAKPESLFHLKVINGITFVRIDEKIKSERNDEFVYTLGIEEDHSYNVEGLICKNCFVIESPYDSYAGIMKTDQEEAHIMKRRGGVGFDISTIRPKGLKTNNAAKTTDGIGLFMERFSNTCREVAQGGRRGALMLSISVHHPEIKTFINIKRDIKKVTGANISVRVSDEFMNAVKNNEKVELRWPVESKNPTISEMVDANEIWTELISAAHASAEPGILFWDNALNFTPAEVYADVGYHHTSTNPCGEIVLSPMDSCRLLLVNLTGFVNNAFLPNAEFDFSQYTEVVQKAQRMMDDVIDLELECIDKILAKIDADPEPENVKVIERDLWKGIREAAVNGRRTGLGITGLGDCLAALGVRYGSDESIEMTETIYKNLAINSYHASVIMAKERGAFPVFSHELEKDHPFLQRIWDASPGTYEMYLQHGRRNIANTTTAPAGSVSTLTQTTSGIEPAFMLSYVRRKKVNPDSKDVRVDFVDQVGDSWQEFTVYHHGVKAWMDATGKTDIKESPYHGATAMDNDWVQGVKLQGAAQKWICHAISRTANLPADTTIDTVKNIYMAAWKAGCKGYTIYRDGCRSGVLIDAEKSAQNKNIDNSGRPTKIIPTQSPKRPKELPCDIHQVSIKGVKWTVIVGLLYGAPYEMFIGHSDLISLPSKCSHGKVVKHNKGKYDLHVDVEGEDLIIKDVIKTFDSKDSAWATRMFSINLRHGVSVEFLVDQLSKDGLITDFNKVIARILKKYIKDGTKATGQKCSNILSDGSVCNSDNLFFQEGCLTCKQCGYSKCG